MISDRCLTIYDPDCEDIIVTADASDVGIGAVLPQVQDGKERQIAFASHTLLERECKYSPPERVALACVWGVNHIQKFAFFKILYPTE